MERMCLNAETELPDLSQSHAAPDIALQQRALADTQLADMYAGRVVRHFQALAEALSNIPHPAVYAQPLRLLDVGCGSAYYQEVIRHLSGRNFDYTGADYNDGMLALARQRYPQVRLIRTDVRKIDVPDRAFDVVLSGACLVHVREWQDALGELIRVSARWIVLHRTLIRRQAPTEIKVEHLYDRDMYRVYIHDEELRTRIAEFGCRIVAGIDCGEGYRGPVVGNYTYLLERTSAEAATC
jgi:SAM-dependent methyltransferase